MSGEGEESVSPLIIQYTRSLFHLVHAPPVTFIPQIPWSVAIPATTVVFRTAVTLPLSVYQQRYLAKLSSLRPLLLGWQKALATSLRSQGRKEKWTFEQFQKVHKLQVMHCWDSLDE